MKKFFSVITILLIAFLSVSCGNKASEDGEGASAKPKIDVVATYQDVAADMWYTDAISWGVNEDIMVAAKPNYFGVLTPLAKKDVVIAMWKTAGAPGQVISAKTVSDSDPNSDFSKAMTWAISNNVITSEELNSMKDSATRLEAIEYMWNQNEKPVVQNYYSFDDTVGIDSVAWAKLNKITYGVSPTLFAPDMDCTKSHMITFLYRAK